MYQTCHVSLVFCVQHLSTLSHDLKYDYTFFVHFLLYNTHDLIPQLDRPIPRRRNHL